MARYQNRRSSGGSRWMALRYPGECKVCGTRIAKGTTAFYDAGAKTVTCLNIECCDADGLVTWEPLTGPWDKRTDLRKRAETRVGAPAPVPPRIITTRFNSGAVAYVNSRGRCEDAPCCGCCS
jgi:hypothetical protein